MIELHLNEIQLPEDQMKANMLAYLAKQHVGLREQGGDNQGQMVERFQMAVDSRAQGEPWCLSFIQYLAKIVDEMFDAMTGNRSGHNRQLYATEHVLTLWNKTSKEQRIFKPEMGCLILWAYYHNEKQTGSGHVGIVTRKELLGMVQTVEGNTSPSVDEIDRDGDGVFLKNRNITYHYGSMRPLGFLKVW